MTKYPFEEKVEEYLVKRKDFLAETTFKGLERRLYRIGGDLKDLRQDGKISTLSPKSMTSEDVLAFIVYRKGKKVSFSDISHDISALKQVLTFAGNTAVQNCLSTNPDILVRKKKPRLDPLSENTYAAILDRYEQIDHQDFKTVRAYVLSILYIGTGARNKELRLANRKDVDIVERTIHLEHVKGEDSWGSPRNVIIPKEIMPIVEQYLYDRDVYLAAHKATSDALFFTLGGDFSHMSGNSIRRAKSIVENDIGKKFEYRDCRRAYGQMYLNKGASIEQVSVAMGHASTETTELYYCRKSESQVNREIKDLW